MCYNCNRTVTIHLPKVWKTTTVGTDTAGGRFATQAEAYDPDTTVNVVYYSS